MIAWHMSKALIYFFYEPLFGYLQVESLNDLAVVNWKQIATITGYKKMLFPAIIDGL